MVTSSPARLPGLRAVFAALAIALVTTLGWPMDSGHAQGGPDLETPCTGDATAHVALDGADCTADCCHVWGPFAALPPRATGLTATRGRHQLPARSRRRNLGRAGLLRPPRH
jgi:hypothetical protein